MSALVALVMAQLSGPVAQVDLRGHSPTVIQSVLEGQLPQLASCRRPPPEPTLVRGRPVPAVRASRLEVDVQFVISPSGAVASVQVPSVWAFLDGCLHKQLLRLEFGPRPHDATARDTLVTATLRCTDAECRWTWMPPPDAGP